MNTSVTRVLVLIFAAAALGSLSLTPRLSYGLSADSPQNSEHADRVEAQRAFNDSYNQAYDEAKAQRQSELEDEGESGGSCGG